MVDVDARVDHAHDDVPAAGGDLPGIFHLDQLVGILVGEIRIVRRAADPIFVVRLDGFDLGVGLQFRTDSADIPLRLEHIVPQQLTLWQWTSGSSHVRRGNSYAPPLTGGALSAQGFVDAAEHRTLLSNTVLGLKPQEGRLVPLENVVLEKRVDRTGVSILQPDDHLSRYVGCLGLQQPFHRRICGYRCIIQLG